MYVCQRERERGGGGVEEMHTAGRSSEGKRVLKPRTHGTFRVYLSAAHIEKKIDENTHTPNSLVCALERHALRGTPYVGSW